MRPELSGLFRLWVLEQVRGGNVVSERKKEGRRERWGGGGRGWIERGRRENAINNMNILKTNSNPRYWLKGASTIYIMPSKVKTKLIISSF